METLLKLKTIHEEQHRPYSRIITDLVNSKERNCAELSGDDISRIAEVTASLVLEKIRQELPLLQSEGMMAASVPNPKEYSKGHGNDVTRNRTNKEDDDVADFENTSIDFGFLGL